jgi:hypothetical protein
MLPAYIIDWKRRQEELRREQERDDAHARLEAPPPPREAIPKTSDDMRIVDVKSLALPSRRWTHT